MDANLVLAVLIVVVLLFSAFQAVQIAGLSGMVSASTTSAAPSSGGYQQSPTSIPASNPAPTMVGGC